MELVNDRLVENYHNDIIDEGLIEQALGLLSINRDCSIQKDLRRTLQFISKDQYEKRWKKRIAFFYETEDECDTRSGDTLMKMSKCFDDSNIRVVVFCNIKKDSPLTLPTRSPQYLPYIDNNDDESLEFKCSFRDFISYDTKYFDICITNSTDNVYLGNMKNMSKKLVLVSDTEVNTQSLNWSYDYIICSSDRIISTKNGEQLFDKNKIIEKYIQSPPLDIDKYSSICKIFVFHNDLTVDEKKLLDSILSSNTEHYKIMYSDMISENNVIDSSTVIVNIKNKSDNYRCRMLSIDYGFAFYYLDNVSSLNKIIGINDESIFKSVTYCDGAIKNICQFIIDLSDI